MPDDSEKTVEGIRLPENAHMVMWTKEKIKRFWEFYQLNPLFKTWFFSETQAKVIIKLVKKYLEKNQKY